MLLLLRFYVFYVFLKIKKWLFTLFCFASHVFSNYVLKYNSTYHHTTTLSLPYTGIKLLARVANLGLSTIYSIEARVGLWLRPAVWIPMHTAYADATQPSSWASTSAVRIEFATSSRRLPADLVEKLKTEHVESSWVASGVVYSPVGSRGPVSNSAANSTG